MKRILLIALWLLLLAACNKNVSTTGSTKIILSPVVVDTFTLTDNGVAYIDSAGRLPLTCYIQRTSTGSILAFSNNSTSFFPYEIEIQSVSGPMNSVGIYKIAPADSFVSGGYEVYEISDSNEVIYWADSLMFNITYAGGDTVKGSYTMWLRSGINTKTVSGIIRCYDAQIY